MEFVGDSIRCVKFKYLSPDGVLSRMESWIFPLHDQSVAFKNQNKNKRVIAFDEISSLATRELYRANSNFH